MKRRIRPIAPPIEDRTSLRLSVLQREFRYALRNNDEDRIIGLTGMIGVSPVSDKHVAMICSLIRSGSFRTAPDAPGCLLIMLSGREFTASQLRRLLREIEPVYSRTRARCWYTCFATSELVRDFPVADALEMFLRLANTSNEIARSFVPHALEHIITDSGSERLAGLALKKLQAMANDPSQRVREELGKSLIRIQAKTPDVLES
jgi:hypothetical protein